MHENQTDSDPGFRSEAVRFVMLVLNAEGERTAGLTIHSLRRFGGHLGACPIWVFHPDTTDLSPALADIEGVHVEPLMIEEDFPRYPFSAKVHTCAQAEAMSGSDVHTLVWLSTSTLIVQPPDLLNLSTTHDAAFRPVHIRNVGASAHEPLNAYWTAVYHSLGIDDPPHSVESYVDGQHLRPYFNTHLFAVDPAWGVMQAWLVHFTSMVTDELFQSGPCANELQRIFLHQVVLSALLPVKLDWERIRLLPPEYSYPLHLHHEIPSGKQPGTLNELVCPVYEGSFCYPETLSGLQVEEPLRSWLVEHSHT